MAKISYSGYRFPAEIIHLGRRVEDLSTGGDLDDFLALLERRELWTSPLERDFVRHSRGARERRVHEEADRRAHEQQVRQALRVSESLRLATEARQAAAREPATALRVAWEAVLWDRNELSEGVFRETLARLPAPVRVIGESDRLGKGSFGYDAGGAFLCNLSGSFGLMTLVVVGLVMTAVMQSSTASIAVTLSAYYAGAIGVDQGCARDKSGPRGCLRPVFCRLQHQATCRC